jgi:alkylation response protein AidB-like acyl-CoA dehydrogenase
MAVLNTLTAEYCKTRVAFGQPIGKFQALQHRLVDMVVAEGQATSMAILAALKLDAPPLERAQAVSAAKAKIGRTGRLVGEGTVQLHGGIGTTDELSVGHYLKRLMAIGVLFGDADFHTRRFATLTRPAG